MNNITTKDSSDRTSWSLGKIHKTSTPPQDPGPDLQGSHVEPSSQESAPFLGLAAGRVGYMEPWERKKTGLQYHLFLLTPSSFPTQGCALKGTICSHTKEKTALLWVLWVPDLSPDVGMVCFLGCLELYTFLSGVCVWGAFYRHKQRTRLQGRNL